MATLLTWESEKDFRDAVRDNLNPWVYRKAAVMQALYTRACATTDKEQLRYAAAYFYILGDESAADLARLAAM